MNRPITNSNSAEFSSSTVHLRRIGWLSCPVRARLESLRLCSSLVRMFVNWPGKVRSRIDYKFKV